MGYSRERRERAIDLWRTLRPGLSSDRQALLEVARQTGISRDTIRRWIKQSNTSGAQVLSEDVGVNDSDLMLAPNSIGSLATQLDRYSDSLDQHQRALTELRSRVAQLDESRDREGGRGGKAELDQLMNDLRDHQENLRELLDSAMSMAVGRYRDSLQAVGANVGMSPTGVRHRVSKLDVDRAFRFLDAGPQLLNRVESLTSALETCGGVLTNDVETAFANYFLLLNNMISAIGYGQRWMTPEQGWQPTLRVLDHVRELNKSVYDSIKRVKIEQDWQMLRSSVELEIAIDSIRERLSTLIAAAGNVGERGTSVASPTGGGEAEIPKFQR
jgi:transposase-like protein